MASNSQYFGQQTCKEPANIKALYNAVKALGHEIEETKRSRSISSYYDLARV